MSRRELHRLQYPLVHFINTFKILLFTGIHKMLKLITTKYSYWLIRRIFNQTWMAKFYFII